MNTLLVTADNSYHKYASDVATVEASGTGRDYIAAQECLIDAVVL